MILARVGRVARYRCPTQASFAMVGKDSLSAVLQNCDEPAHTCHFERSEKSAFFRQPANSRFLVATLLGMTISKMTISKMKTRLTFPPPSLC
jgi:hypothetical protein